MVSSEFKKVIERLLGEGHRGMVQRGFRFFNKF